jgi:uncharacterized membrane protein
MKVVSSFSRIVLSAFIVFGLVIPSTYIFAQEELDPTAARPPIPGTDTFYRGRVTNIISDEKQDTSLNIAGAAVFTQMVSVELLSGPKKGSKVEMQYGGLKDNQKLRVDDQVIVIAPGSSENPDTLYIFEKYRLNAIYFIIGIFFVLTIFFARWQGARSLLGLAVSILILTLYVVPQILAGKNALFVILLGSFGIATLSIYLAHGFHRRTHVAFISTLISVGIAVGLSTLFVWLTKLLGAGSEEAFYLQTAGTTDINLQGLLLGGIIIGALGVLDDITTAQSATIDELHKANPTLTAPELFQRGLSVGKEHIASLVNTLVLAYAGASFPALLLFTVYQRPFWVVMNTEVISEEIVRTLVGSIALMCAVPITTAIAAYFLPKREKTTIA